VTPRAVCLNLRRCEHTQKTPHDTALSVKSQLRNTHSIQEARKKQSLHKVPEKQHKEKKHLMKNMSNSLASPAKRGKCATRVRRAGGAALARSTCRRDGTAAPATTGVPGAPADATAWRQPPPASREHPQTRRHGASHHRRPGSTRRRDGMAPATTGTPSSAGPTRLTRRKEKHSSTHECK